MKIFHELPFDAKDVLPRVRPVDSGSRESWLFVDLEQPNPFVDVDEVVHGEHLEGPNPDVRPTVSEKRNKLSVDLVDSLENALANGVVWNHVGRQRPDVARRRPSRGMSHAHVSVANVLKGIPTVVVVVIVARPGHRISDVHRLGADADSFGPGEHDEGIDVRDEKMTSHVELASLIVQHGRREHLSLDATVGAAASVATALGIVDQRDTVSLGGDDGFPNPFLLFTQITGIPISFGVVKFFF